MNSWREYIKKYGFIISCSLFFLTVLIFFRGVLLPFILAIVFAYVLAPAINWLCSFKIWRLRLSRWVSVLIIYNFLFCILGIFSWYFLPRLAGELSSLVHEIPGFFKTIKEKWVPRINWEIEKQLIPYFKATSTEKKPKIKAPSKKKKKIILKIKPLKQGDYEINLKDFSFEVQRLGKDRYRIKPSLPTRYNLEKKLKIDIGYTLNKAIGGIIDESEFYIKSGLRLVQDIVYKIVNMIFTFLLILMVTAFILVDTEKIFSFFRLLLPSNFRRHYDIILKGIDKGLSGVIRGQILICILNGVLSGIGFYLIGIKFWPVLTVIAGVMMIVPIFGTILSSIPVVLIGLAQSPTKGLMVLLWIIGIHILEAYFLNPKIMGETAKIHPAVVVFSLIAGAYAFGVLGALLAIPVASILKTLLLYFKEKAYAE